MRQLHGDPQGRLRLLQRLRRGGELRLRFRQAALCAFLSCGSAAAVPTLEGSWKTIDDHSGQVRSIVRIIEVGGEYQGRIERVFPQPGEDPNPRCEDCEGARHNQPLAGMLILEHLRREGEDYVGGQILDPETGSVYRARATLAADGAELRLRGYIGLSLFGRSQTWLRAAP